MKAESVFAAASGQQKTPALEAGVSEKRWCSRRDSNPQALRHMPLKHARIPIPPLEQEC